MRLDWRRLVLFLLAARPVAGWISSSTTTASWASSRCLAPSSTTLYMGLRGKKIRKEKRRAAREETPPRIVTPYGPIRLPKPPRVCDVCNGRGLVRCGVCEGRGVVRASGQPRRNRIVADRLVKSQWTSVEVYHGHRHHTVEEVRGSLRKQNLQVRMRNCCGEPQDFWIDAEELHNKRIWRMGWQTLEQILQADGGPLVDACRCFRCKGGRILRCIDCDGVGEIPSYEPLHD